MKYNKIFSFRILKIRLSFLGEAYVKLNLLQDGKKHFKRATELTKNEHPHLALARLYLSEDMIPEARNAYTAALR